MIVFWVPNLGPPIPLSAMTDKHVINCIFYLMSGQMERTGCSGFTNFEWIRIFHTELQRRIRLHK